MLEIDGSRGEGGGQMVRTSVAMATVTKQPVILNRIRENRPTNGLSKQHCAAVNAVAQMAGSTAEGNVIGSRTLVFTPGDEQVSDIKMNIGTAGSVSLVLQAMFLAARNHKERLTVDISGGTNVMWAPPIDSYQYLLFPLMHKMGIDADVRIIDRGFYPQGGGRVIASLEPIGDITPLDIDSLGELKSVKGVCFSQRLPDWIDLTDGHCLAFRHIACRILHPLDHDVLCLVETVCLCQRKDQNGVWAHCDVYLQIRHLTSFGSHGVCQIV